MRAETLTRSYKYALHPAPVQVEAMDQAAAAAKRYWNALVAAQRWAEGEIRHGRHGSVVKAYQEILLAKSLTGVAAANANKLSLEKGISVEEACRLQRLEAAKERAKVVRTKDGNPLRCLSRRKLAVAYAIESVEATRKKKGSRLEPQVAYGLISKFEDATKLYVSGKRGRPKFKGTADSVSLQCQVTKTSPNPLSLERDNAFVNLTRVAGERCSKVPVVFHRPLPKGCTVKRVALTLRGQRRCVVFQLDAPREAFVRDFTANPGQVAGIDPGRKVALSISSVDGSYTKAVQPPIGQDRRYLKKLARTQRKLDRQRRAANPDCFDEEGRWKRGHRAKVRTKGMAKTQDELSEMARHLVDARTDFYHNAAIELLNRFDTVGAGKWRGLRPARGKKMNRAQRRKLQRSKASAPAKARRACRRKDAGHAISEFVGILKDKASLSESPKVVWDTNERNTTKRCVACGEATGPSGLEKLHIRDWTCSACGVKHQRDFAAARAIAIRAQQETSAGAHSRAYVVKAPKRKRRGPQGQTKAEPKGSSVPVPDEASPAREATRLTPSATSAARAGQVESASLPPVAGVISNDLPRGNPRHAPARGKPLVEGTAEPVCA